MNQPTILSSPDELEAAFDASREQPVFVFKHSLTCPISSAAWERYNDFIGEHSDAAQFTAIEIQTTRDLSILVTEKARIRHESPQALLLRDGEVIWHASHGSITEQSLGEALRSLDG